MGIAGLLVAGSLGAPIAAAPAAEGGGNGQAAEAPIEGTGPALDPVASGDLTFKGLEASPAPSFETAQELTGPAGTPLPSGEGPVMAAPAPVGRRWDGLHDTRHGLGVDGPVARAAASSPWSWWPSASCSVGLRLAGRRLSARG